MTIEEIWSNTEITEILLSGPNRVSYELHGKLINSDASFESEIAYEQYVEKICDDARIVTDLDQPFGNGQIPGFRIHVVAKCYTGTHSHLSIRRLGTATWNLDRLAAHGWCSAEQIQLLRKIVRDRKNILVVGPTGSGKTSVLQSLIEESDPFSRNVILEDTPELHPRNSQSLSLRTREWETGSLSRISLNDLIKQSLRMRPDRLIVGEVRGAEAKDLLLALSSGHAGSMGTLHASNPFQALQRLEMLILMGAPQWTMSAVRKLIFFSLHTIVVCGKTMEGQRRLSGIYHLASLEDQGYTMEEVC